MTEKTEIQVTTVLPDDLFQNARFHGSRRALLGSCLKDEIPFQTTFDSNVRRIFVLRHGERVDYVFPNFTSVCFDSEGNYTRNDLNMPKTLPKRANPVENWKKDTPITNIGMFQAEQIGKGIKESGIVFDTILCSPFFRCVQTCDAFLKGMKLHEKVKICIDPALYEWTGWKMLHGWDTLGDLFNPKQYSEMGFNIDLEYKPIMSVNELKAITNEDFIDTFKRNSKVVEKTLENSHTKTVLIVAHGMSLISCVRKFVSSVPNSRLEILKSFQKSAYCGFVGIEERSDKWEYITPPLSSFTHAGNQRTNIGMPDEMRENVEKKKKFIFGHN